MNAGATPNDTTSAIESNSTPNWVVVFVSRATLPSSMSISMATKIEIAASVKRPSAARMIARNPQKRLPVVSRLGSRKMPRRRCSRNSCHRRRRGSRPPSPPMCRRLISLASPKPRHDRLAPPHPVTYLDAEHHVSRHDEIRPGAESNEPEPLARLELVPRPHAAHDAPRHHARDLAHRHARPVALDPHLAALVALRRLRPVRGRVTAAGVLDAVHQPRHRRAVHVDVERR